MAHIKLCDSNGWMERFYKKITYIYIYIYIYIYPVKLLNTSYSNHRYTIQTDTTSQFILKTIQLSQRISGTDTMEHHCDCLIYLHIGSVRSLSSHLLLCVCTHILHFIINQIYHKNPIYYRLY